MGGLAFALAARVAMRGPRGVSLCAAAGAAAALAFLTKYTNAFALVLCALAFATLLWRERGQGVRQLAPPLIGGAVLVLPTAAWLIRNQLRFGSLTATAHKVELLGWQPKPLLSWWDHPLFTPSGLAAFVTDLVPMFWRGEIVWRRQALALPAADAFFVFTSAVAVALAVWWTWRHRKRTGLVEAGALLALFVAVSTLGILSLAFEFHARSNPPDHHPYFVQGRLISGAMLPFALLYVRGIAAATEWATPGVARVLRASLLAVVALVVVGSEIALTRPVFASAYNLYQVGAE